VICGHIVLQLKLVNKPGTRNMLRNLLLSLMLVTLMAVLPSGAMAAPDADGVSQLVGLGEALQIPTVRLTVNGGCVGVRRLTPTYSTQEHAVVQA